MDDVEKRKQFEVRAETILEHQAEIQYKYVKQLIKVLAFDAGLWSLTICLTTHTKERKQL